jgi:Protein of unknown function (DUF5132)
MQWEQAPERRTSSGRFGRLVTALVAGVAGGLIAPLIYPAVARNARPAARKALKAGIAAVEHGRVAIAEFAEHASDLMAEARAEYDQEQKPSPSPDPAVSPAVSKEVVRLRGPARETTSP